MEPLFCMEVANLISIHKVDRWAGWKLGQIHAAALCWISRPLILSLQDIISVTKGNLLYLLHIDLNAVMSKA